MTNLEAFRKTSKEQQQSIIACTKTKLFMKLEDPTETYDLFLGEVYYKDLFKRYSNEEILEIAKNDSNYFLLDYVIGIIKVEDANKLKDELDHILPINNITETIQNKKI